MDKTILYTQGYLFLYLCMLVLLGCISSLTRLEISEQSRNGLLSLQKAEI